MKDHGLCLNRLFIGLWFLCIFLINACTHAQRTNTPVHKPVMFAEKEKTLEKAWGGKREFSKDADGSIKYEYREFMGVGMTTTTDAAGSVAGPTANYKIYCSHIITVNQKGEIIGHITFGEKDLSGFLVTPYPNFQCPQKLP